MLGCSKFRGALLVGSALWTAGCGSGATAQSQDLIGGEEGRDPSGNAVGALVSAMNMADGMVYQAFCTATLIAPKLVVTAEHCTRHNVAGFAMGPLGQTILGDARRQPERVVPIVAVHVEREVTGGGLGLGSDVAVMELGEEVLDVEPVELGALKSSDVGRTFTAVGYGASAAGDRLDGVRRSGPVTLRAIRGKILPVLYPSFEAYHEDYGGNLEQDRAYYDSLELLEDYEVLAGGAEGDAQGCEGDSGGPLLGEEDGALTTFGVASWVLLSKDAECDVGTVYASFGPKALEFVKGFLP